MIALAAFALPARAEMAQVGGRVELGKLQTGATVAFVENAPGDWGMEIAGSAHLLQAKPARVEAFHNQHDIRRLASGYTTVAKTATGVEARADIGDDGGVLFRVDDEWSIDGAVLSVKRRVEAVRNAPGGFSSTVTFDIDPSVSWNDVKFLAPGVLYGDPTYDGERSPGGTLNFAAHRLVMREDILPAPLFALSFADGASIAMLDPTPRGDTTEAETTLAEPVLTDARFQFGAMGAAQDQGGPIELAFTFPGTVSLYPVGPGAPAQPQLARRYHPIATGTDHHYQVSLRFGEDESFRDLTREAWRWAWTTLKPEVIPIDLGLVRRVLLDHLEAHAATIGGRTGMPFVLSTMVNKLQWNWTMVAMGFVGKDLELADELLL